VIETNDDPPEGIDMYLLYLYTLQPPRLLTNITTLYALILGDKYNAPALGDVGKSYAIGKVADNLLSTTRNGIHIETWIHNIECYWSLKMPMADDIKAALLESIAMIADYLIVSAAF